MFSGLFIAITIWKFGYQTWKECRGRTGTRASRLFSVGVPAFREEFINTGDNDIHVGKWWDMSPYFLLNRFHNLIVSYFADMIRNTPMFVIEQSIRIDNHPGLLKVVASIFIGFNKLLTSLPLYRNVPRADCDITMLPGGDDDFVSLASEKEFVQKWTNFEAEIAEATA